MRINCITTNQYYSNKTIKPAITTFGKDTNTVFTDIRKVIKDNNFKINNIAEWDYNVLTDFVNNKTLQNISKKNPIKAYYSEFNDEYNEYAQIEIKFDKNEFIFVGAGDNNLESTWDLKSDIKKYTKEGELTFLKHVQKYMEENLIPLKNLEKLKNNKIKLITKTPIPDSLLDVIANSEVLKEIAKDNNGMKIKYKKDTYQETAYLYFKFGNKEYKISGVEIMAETADDELLSIANEINEKGKQDFLDKAETYTKERAKLSFLEKLFDF